MEMSMRESGRMGSRKEEELLLIRTEGYMMEFGSKQGCMVKGF